VTRRIYLDPAPGKIGWGAGSGLKGGAADEEDGAGGAAGGGAAGALEADLERLAFLQGREVPGAQAAVAARRQEAQGDEPARPGGRFDWTRGRMWKVPSS
jgi:hypothetical protein